jgi:hypothetical protein
MLRRAEANDGFYLLGFPAMSVIPKLFFSSKRLAELHLISSNHDDGCGAQIEDARG